MFVGDCRRFIRWAAADGSGVACPDFVGDFKCPAVHQTEPKHLEPEQVALLLAEVKDTPLEVPAALAALAGLRRAEFLGLDAQDIDWDRQVLHVRSTKTHRDARVEIGPQLLEILKRHRVAAGPVVRLGPHIRNAYRSLHAACRRVHIRLRAAKYLADPASGCPTEARRPRAAPGRTGRPATVPSPRSAGTPSATPSRRPSSRRAWTSGPSRTSCATRRLP